MEFNRETFEKALKANKIVKHKQHFEAVVKSYLELENQALRIHDVVGRSEQLTPFKCPNCGNDWDIDKVNSCECGASVRR